MAETQVLDACPLPPGADFFTGSTRGPFIDTGHTIDRLSQWGRVYFTEDTVGEWARRFGWIPPHEYEDLADSLASARRKILDLSTRIDELEKVEQALSAAHSVLEGVPSVTVPDDPANAGEDDSEAPQEFPHHKGAGWWVLSNGETIRGDKGTAEAEEAKVRKLVTA